MASAKQVTQFVRRYLRMRKLVRTVYVQEASAMSANATQQQNILLISDLHLGEDIKPATRMGQLRHMVMLERELLAFLSHYTKVRHDGRPWRLVVNGDMVDFLAVCLLPREGEVDA